MMSHTRELLGVRTGHEEKHFFMIFISFTTFMPHTTSKTTRSGVMICRLRGIAYTWLAIWRAFSGAWSIGPML